MFRRMEVLDHVKAALECSIYWSPADPGLRREELFEVGRRLGYGEGEIGDVLQQAAAPLYFGDAKYLPQPNIMWAQFHISEEPDYRNLAAFDFVCAQLRELARAQGAARASMTRAVLIERGAASGVPRRDLEVAVAMLVLSEHLKEKDGVVRFAEGRDTYPTPSEQHRQAGPSRARGRPNRKEARERAYGIVRDVVERRTDGRPDAAEPLDAFAESLEGLGYAPFRLWWKQSVSELRRLDTSLSPVAATVLAAALVEGALTFVVKHARGLRLAVFGSKDFDRDPRTWKIDDLVASATTGQESALLDPSTRARADQLIKTRQRIHAGRMLSEYPGGVPDLRPEEARDAKATADLVVRRVLDWLQKYPPT